MLRNKMMMLVAFAALTTLSIFSTNASAQCRDTWISQAVQEVSGRAVKGSGDADECKKTNYGGGNWSSYPDLVNKVRAAGVCKDPWITQAFKEVKGSGPAGWGLTNECTIKLYNNGSWSSYNQLRDAVRAYHNSIRVTPILFVPVYKPGVNTTTDKNAVAVIAIEGLAARLQARLVGNDGASLIGNDSAGIIAASTSTLKRADMVAAGGLNLTVSSRSLLATRTSPIAGGKTLKY
jgi:hypothetical protein